jgi:quercetin dioxygenase-like cupin family protein
MGDAQVKSHDSPDETRKFTDKGQVEIVKLSSGTVGRGTFEPGWRWSEHVKPIAKTDSCQSVHVGYVISGRMHTVMDDGSEFDIGAGDAVFIPAGHDAWTLGDESCVMFDFSGMENYAK